MYIAFLKCQLNNSSDSKFLYIGLFSKIPECLFPMQCAIYILSNFAASSNEQNMFMDDEGMFIIFTMLHDYYYNLSYGEFELS